MEQKSKRHQLFILLIIAASALALLCLTGCGGSCFGCSIGCENEEDVGCFSGCSYESDGLLLEDTYYCTFNCVKEDIHDKDSHKVLLLSCEDVSDGLLGDDGCYNGLACGGCGTCAMVCGESDGLYDEDESTYGCVSGCLTCGDSDGVWREILQHIYDYLDID